MKPAEITLTADRWVPFVHSFTFIGEDFGFAPLVAQIRMAPDIPGSPLISLGALAAPAQGLSSEYSASDTMDNHVLAGRLSSIPTGYLGSDIETLSIIEMRIDEATIEGLPFPGSGGAGERGDDLTLAWDMHITPVGGIKTKYIGGKFVVRAGVTQ